MANKDIIEWLREEIKGDILSDEYSLAIYATDASVYQIKPIVVVLPINEADVVTAIRIASAKNISILPRGAGTSLAGQTVGQSMILDFSKYMHEILELNINEKWVRVQPGVVLDVLNDYLHAHGLQFAPDPATSSRANIGGMVGNNSSGTKSILYGKTVDHILESRVILADGEKLFLEKISKSAWLEKSLLSTREGQIYNSFKNIIDNNQLEIKQRFPKVMRRVGGYNLDEFINESDWNLSKLITGSEGTLATATEFKLNLVALPACKAVCVVHFDQVLKAIQSVATILEFSPAAVEILDETVISLSRKNLTTQRSCHFISGDPAAILIVEFYGHQIDELQTRAKNMIEKLKSKNFGYAYPFFPEGKAYDDVWIIRKKGLGLMLGMQGDKKPLPFIEDAGIPINHLPEYIDQVIKICKKHQTAVAMYAHASVGVIHVRPILDLRKSEDISRFEHISMDTFKLVKKYGGSWSGEHGDGLVRSFYNQEFFGEKIYHAFRDIKKLFDPNNLMNPGKIVDSPPITHNLRYGTKYSDQKVETHFHFRQDQSFESAVHMCTGVGECRKLMGGTMCPSFKATRDEEHSTRGRANALRQAMSGQLGPAGLGNKRLHQVMDLCISCKACKSECPSNVDMAKLKGEVNQAYFDTHGLTLRDRLISGSPAMARKIAGKFARLVNYIQSTKIFRGTIQQWVGFDKNRILPSYASQTFSDWFKKYYVPNQGRDLALYVDTYMNYHEPQIGISAVKLLNKLDYNVVLADIGCCQRPNISHGLLRKAKMPSTALTNALMEFLEMDIPVIVCEPSCYSSLVDDIPDLIDDPLLASKLNKGIFMIDQFIYQEILSKKIQSNLSPAANNIVLHGHCHQKALYGTESMKSSFHELTGEEMQEIQSGCCGMAGSFGYEKEHHKISEKMGSAILFPAINNLDKDTEIIACGFSCRHQIRHFTGRKAKHWVQAFDL